MDLSDLLVHIVTVVTPYDVMRKLVNPDPTRNGQMWLVKWHHTATHGMPTA